MTNLWDLDESGENVTPDSGDNRPPVYWEDNVLIVRASAVGSGCLWELVAAGQGEAPAPLPPVLVKAFSDGHRLEPMVIQRLKDDHGMHLVSAQDEGELVLSPTLKIRYHPDGIVEWDDGFREDGEPGFPSILEVKTVANAGWQTIVRGTVPDYIAEYAWQASVMMHATGLPLVWATYNKGNSDGSDCPDQGKIHLEVVTTPPISLETIRARALDIKIGVEGESIVASGRPCDDPTNWPCRYLHLRPEVSVDTPTSEASDVIEIPAEDADEYNRLAREYISFKAQADEMVERRDAAKQRLIELAGNRKAKLVSDEFVVPVTKGAGKSGYAWDEMPQELKDQLEQYKRPGKPYLYIRGAKRVEDT